LNVFSEFVVLLPEVGLQDFRCSREPKHRCIAKIETTTAFFRPLVRENR
jgi:hypothetical protein